MEDYPDGTNPYQILQKWHDWVVDWTRIMDGDSCYAHYKYPGNLSDQPAYDMQVFDIIRTQWITERNKKNGK